MSMTSDSGQQVYLDEQPAEEDMPRRFEDLTLAEAVGQLFQAPRTTVRALQQVAAAPRQQRTAVPVASVPVREAEASQPAPVRSLFNETDKRLAQQLGMRLVALLVAWWGAGILANSPQRTEAQALNVGAPFLILGFMIWLVAEAYGDWPAIRRWWHERGSTTVEREPSKSGDSGWTGLHPVRVLAGLGGLLFSILAVRFTSGNQFTFIGFWSWIVSVALWVYALSPAYDGPYQWLAGALDNVRRFRWRSWTVLAMALILLLGAAFRLADLPGAAPEMTSDHVEKVLDSFEVLNGQHLVFFPDNGGREGFQMYAMALLSQVPGLGMNFTTLKLLSALEGLVAVLLMFWMGREIVGERDRRLGNLVGVLLAALVATSYWHAILSRMGLRIVLTTVVAAALLVFLARAMRHNRRGDFIKAGLVLGFGLYTYQAVRMLPVVVIVGVGLAFVFHARGWRDRWRYVVNFFTLVAVAFIVFLPLFNYSLEYPEDFWRRTSGRLLGDDVITETNEDGEIVVRDATLQERLDAFSSNLPVLADNFRTTLLMFNWKGDVAWINGAPNKPAMDMFTGALLVVGLAAWLARMIRRRDVFDWLVPLALVIMLLPSALAIAYPVENPSHTRTSGALPEAYLIAALPLALLVQSIVRLVPGRRGVIAAVALVALVVLGAYNINTRLYFVEHVEAYIESSYPYSEAGRVLRGFAESDGSYGNAFMMGYAYWWDHRAMGIEAGRPDWPNGVVSVDHLRDFMQAAYEKSGEYSYNPELDALFFLSAEDEDTLAFLTENFPSGRATLRQSYQHDDDYMLYRVPALGTEAFLSWVAAG